MAIDYASRADVDTEVASISGVSELTDQQMRAKGWLTTDPREAPVGYWRLPDDRMERGRITLSQYGRNADDQLDREGYTRLRQYGTYKSNGGPGAWQPWRDPWLGIVQRNGLREFDRQQIIDLGWHRRPKRSDHESHRQVWQRIDALMTERGLTEREAIDRVFPQLVGVEFTDVGCNLCPGRIFATMAQKHKHDAVAHKEEVRSRETREAIAAAISESGQSNAELLAALTNVVTMLAQGQSSETVKRGPGRPRKDATASSDDDE